MTNLISNNPLQVLADAESEANEIRALRAQIRRSGSPDDPDRIARIRVILSRINDAMEPIRSLRGSYLWEDTLLDDDDFERLCRASDALQRDRRQFKKMLR